MNVIYENRGYYYHCSGCQTSENAKVDCQGWKILKFTVLTSVICHNSSYTLVNPKVTELAMVF